MTVAALAIAVVTALLSGCSAAGIYAVPLPGGASVGAHPMHVDIYFDDVLDLVPQSAVKVSGVPVGRVQSIDVAPDGWTARVHVLMDSAVRLPANVRAAVKQTNLLGEKYIELAPPTTEPAQGVLADHAAVPIDHTRRGTEVEEVLGALSLLLNGGGVAQLQPIVVELNKALGGRETRVRSLLEQTNSLVDGLNKQVDDITHALDSLASVSEAAARHTDQIGAIIDELPAGIKILDEQRPQLIGLLTQLDRVGRAGFEVLDRSKDSLIQDLQALRPTLQELGRSAPDLVSALPLIPTYPFPDEAINSAFGGSVNTFLSVDLQIGNTLSNLGVGKPDPVYIPPRYGPEVPVDGSNPYYGGNGPRPGWPTVSLIPLPPSVVVPNGPVDNNPIHTLLHGLGVP